RRRTRTVRRRRSCERRSVRGGEARKQGDKETRRSVAASRIFGGWFTSRSFFQVTDSIEVGLSPCLPLSLSPPLLVSVPPPLLITRRRRPPPPPPPARRPSRRGGRGACAAPVRRLWAAPRRPRPPLRRRRALPSPAG